MTSAGPELHASALPIQGPPGSSVLLPNLPPARWHGLPWGPPSESTLSAGAEPAVERLRSRHPMLDAVIDEIDGRRIRIGKHWLADLASCNYLGFDLDPEILDAVDGAVRRWGTHPSWSRLLGSPRLYEEIETELTELLQAPDTLLMPTITHISTSAIPLLAGRGTVFLDGRAHKTIYDGCHIARGNGARLRRFASGDADQLEDQLRAAPSGQPRLICMDGVNSMTGNIPDLSTFARLAREYDAVLYVDDAHGFGVIGERSPDEGSPYGARGNSVVRHVGEGYDNVILVGGFSKAYSSLLAFLALPTALKEYCKVAAAPYLYSGPSPTASLATVLAGFRVNASRGEALRADLHRKTGRVLGAVRQAGPGHSEPVRPADHRAPARARRGHRRCRPVPLPAWYLPHPRHLPAGAAVGGRRAYSADRRQHRRRDRPPH